MPQHNCGTVQALRRGEELQATTPEQERTRGPLCQNKCQCRLLSENPHSPESSCTLWKSREFSRFPAFGAWISRPTALQSNMVKHFSGNPEEEEIRRRPVDNSHSCKSSSSSRGHPSNKAGINPTSKRIYAIVGDRRELRHTDLGIPTRCPFKLSEIKLSHLNSKEGSLYSSSTEKF